MSINTSILSGIKLFVSNKYRAVTDEPFNFLLPDLASSLGYNRHYMLVLKSCKFVNAFDTILENKNDLFVFKVDGVTRSFIIENGYYDSTTFVSMLNAIFAGVPFAPSVAYDDVERKLVWTVPANHTFQFVKNYVSERGNIPSNSFLSPNRQNRFLEVCGVLTNTDTVYTGVAFYSNSILNLYGTHSITINLQTDLQVITTSHSTPQTIATIPITVGRGELQTWTNSLPVGHSITGGILENLRIYCHDEWEENITGVSPNTLFQLTFLLCPVN